MQIKIILKNTASIMFRIESWQEHKDRVHINGREEEKQSYITVSTATAAPSCQSFISQVSCMLEASLKAAWSFVRVFVADKCVTLWNCVKAL